MSALIWTVFASRNEAAEIIETLLQERLVACANILGEVESHFLWQGKLDKSHECGVLLKTHDALLQPAIDRLEQLHPYETPAILGWKADKAAAATREWLETLNRVNE